MTKEIFTEVTDWQKSTFPTASVLSKMHHLEEEVHELIYDLVTNNKNRRLEFADCFLLLFGAAKADGMEYEDILNCIIEKFEICKSRKWGKPDENRVVKHLPNSEQEVQVSDTSKAK
jgi:hypothetical protein